MKKSISILGCGWLGLALGKFLAKKSYEVSGSTTSEGKIEVLADAGIAPHLLHLGNMDQNTGFFATDILIIAIPPSVANYRDAMQEVVMKAQSSTGRVLFISSTSVYTDRNSSASEGDAELSATTRSGVSLLEVEDLFRNNTHFKTTVIRFAGLYGPGREPGRFLAGRQGVSGASNPVNLIHLDDCIEIIDAIIERDVWGETFNACAPEHPSREAFYTKACLNAGLEPPQFSIKTAPYKIINSGKLVEKLQYAFIHPDPMADV